MLGLLGLNPPPAPVAVRDVDQKKENKQADEKSEMSFTERQALMPVCLICFVMSNFPLIVRRNAIMAAVLKSLKRKLTSTPRSAPKRRSCAKFAVSR
jgi:hypothetical protein